MNPTVIEQVTPAPAPERASRVDAWRWQGVASFDAYKAKVLADEAARASRRAA